MRHRRLKDNLLHDTMLFHKLGNLYSLFAESCDEKLTAHTE